MKEVVFKSISIKNFLSVGNDPIDIKIKSGIHTITGINKDKEDGKNGVGKSTISDAFFFAIFGTTLRPIKKEVITNWINKKECSVTIQFSVTENGVTDEYILLRSLNPSRVQLIKNGEDVSRTIGKTNESIYEILSTTPEMFEQCAIMSLNQVEPFLAKTPVVKRKFIEDIFQIEVFGRMTQFMRTDYNETKRLHDSESDKLSDIEANIQEYKKQQAEQSNKKQQRLNELNSNRDSIKEDIAFTTKEMNEVTPDTITETPEQIQAAIGVCITREKEARALERQLSTTIAVNQNTILNLKNKIKETEKLSDGVCAYCKQPFSDSNKQEKKTLIEKFQSEQIDCERILEASNDEYKAIVKAIEKIEDKKGELLQKQRARDAQESKKQKHLGDIQKYEKMIAQIDQYILNVNTDSVSFDSIIAEHTVRYDALNIVITSYKEKMAIIESSKFIVSDEGVKNFIVKKMLKMLNGRLNYYLKQLDANCTCTFDEYFDEKIINNRGRECSYFNFSGGERKRIDLAMLFTFMDIRRLQSNIAINIGIYDELLDTSLDAKGIEGTLNILKDRVLNNKEAIYVISHRSEAAKHATGEIIYLEKENDITRRKPYDQFYSDSAVSAC